MRLTIEREELAAALDAIVPLVPERTSLPVLSHVVLETGEGNALTVRGTDLDTTAVVRAECEVEERGGAAVPARKLRSLIQSLPKGALELTVRGEINPKLEVQADGGWYHLYGLPADEAPEVAQVGTPKLSLTLPGWVLSEVASRVAFCRSDSESRPALHGIYMHTGEAGELRFVATNGHRMAWAVAEGVEAPNGLGVTLRGAAVAALDRLFAGRDTEVEVSEANHAHFNGVPGARVVSRDIENFPTGYLGVVPEEEKIRTRVVIERAELTEALRRAAVVSSDQTHRASFTFKASEGLTLSTEMPGLGESRRRVPCDVEGPDIHIGFNIVYLREMLDAAGGEKVRLKLTAPERPMVVEPMAERPFNVRYLLMPLLLRS